MTKVRVISGACGFATGIVARKEGAKEVGVAVTSECEMVEKMAPEVAVLPAMAVFVRHPDNPVYRAAGKHLKHVACPVPCGILKALEVEAGLNVPKDASIAFEKE
jgi:hypothetical protein